MDLEERVKNIIMDKLGVDPDKIIPEATFAEDLNIDSLAQMQLVMEFEDQFEISISDEDAQTLTTVGKALEYLKTKVDS